MSESPTGSFSERTRVRRVASRGAYDRETIHAILDEALVCHVGIVSDGQPFVIPMLHARIDDRLYVHGSTGSRLMRQIGGGSPACITVTLLDGLVLARSAFHHSMNYRSVVILAGGEEVRDRERKWDLLHKLVERVIPGRWPDIRPPNENEFKATSLVGFPLDESSAKVRVGPPKDDEEDYALPTWAGVIPLSLNVGPPVPDPRLRVELSVPGYVTGYRRPWQDRKRICECRKANSAFAIRYSALFPSPFTP